MRDLSRIFSAAADDLGAIWFKFILLWYDELSALALRSCARLIMCQLAEL
jgi:hypothetical protein